MIIGKIKLRPNSPSWFDSANNIHLMKPDKAERDITDKHNFESIQQGIDSGKIMFIPCKQEPAAEPVVEEKPKRKRKAKKAEETPAVHVDINVINDNEGGDKE